MIVDCHMHSWRYPDHFVRDVFMASQPPKLAETWSDEQWKAAFDNPVENYLKEMEGVIDKAVIWGGDYSKSMGINIPNEYIADIVKRYPDKFVGGGNVNVLEEGAAKEVERCKKELGLIGIGELGPAYQFFYPHDEKCFPAWEKCQELDMPVCIHDGMSRPRPARLIFSDARYIDEVAVTFPRLKIIIAHLGFHRYEDYINLLYKHENVYADISMIGGIAGLDRRAVSRRFPVVDFGYYYNFLQPLTYYFTQTWGFVDKLLFGTDWTACSPQRLLEILRNLPQMARKLNMPEIPEQAIHNIIYENWKKVFPSLAMESEEAKKET